MVKPPCMKPSSPMADTIYNPYVIPSQKGLTMAHMVVVRNIHHGSNAASLALQHSALCHLDPPFKKQDLASIVGTQEGLSQRGALVKHSLER